MFPLRSHKNAQRNKYCDLRYKEKCTTKDTTVKYIIDFIEHMSPEKKRKLSEESIGILKIYRNIPENVRDPSFGSIINQLKKWGMFDPIPDTSNDLNLLYRNLSRYIHVHPDTLDIVRGARTCDSTRCLIDRKPIKEEIDSYLRRVFRFLNVAIVVQINMLRDVFEELHRRRSQVLPSLLAQIFKYAYMVQLDNVVKCISAIANEYGLMVVQKSALE